MAPQIKLHSTIDEDRCRFVQNAQPCTPLSLYLQRKCRTNLTCHSQAQYREHRQLFQDIEWHHHETSFYLFLVTGTPPKDTVMPRNLSSPPPHPPGPSPGCPRAQVHRHKTLSNAVCPHSSVTLRGASQTRSRVTRFAHRKRVRQVRVGTPENALNRKSGLTFVHPRKPAGIEIKIKKSTHARNKTKRS